MAKYDHGGGCACGLSRFCDCSNATAQDRADRIAYDKQYPKKEHEKMALKQMEDLYDGGYRNPPPNNTGKDIGMRPVVSPMLDVIDKGTLRVSMVVNGVRLQKDIPMPAELSKAMEALQRAASAILSVAP
jgi:hypothetical protein